MLDYDLAELYGVETKQLKRQVKRNIDRFPGDFMFQLAKEEYGRLRCQIGALKRGEHSKYLPYAFTENGVAMLSSVLHSERAIQVNIVIMRTFTRLRRILASHQELALKFKELEQRVGRHDTEIQAIFKVIKRMLAVPEKPRRKIGFIQ